MSVTGDKLVRIEPCSLSDCGRQNVRAEAWPADPPVKEEMYGPKEKEPPAYL